MKDFVVQKNIPFPRERVKKYLADIDRCKRLTPEYEAELGYDAQNGDAAARDKIIEGNLGFVVSVAKSYSGLGIPFEDIVSYGNLGMVKAANKWNPTMGFKFISYAVWQIRAEINLAFPKDQLIAISGSHNDFMQKVQRMKNAFYSKNFGRNPTLAELAEEMDVSVHTVYENLSNNVKCISLDENKLSEQDIVFVSCEQEDRSRSLAKDIENALMVLNPMEREIVKSYFGLGREELTLEDIAERCGKTRERVRQIKESSIRKLKRERVKSLLCKYLG